MVWHGLDLSDSEQGQSETVVNMVMNLQVQ